MPTCCHEEEEKLTYEEKAIMSKRMTEKILLFNQIAAIAAVSMKNKILSM